MDGDIKAELTRLHEYAEASGMTFEEIAASQLVTYKRSLKTTRQALADVQEHKHFARFPLSVPQ